MANPRRKKALAETKPETVTPQMRIYLDMLSSVAAVPGEIERLPYPPDTRLRDIFAFGQWGCQSSWEDLVALAEERQSGAVKVSAVNVPRLPRETVLPHMQFSGGDEHRYLAACGGAWLASIGKAWFDDGLSPALCRYAGGGKADVMAEDRSIAIECGVTRASKVLDGLAKGIAVLVMPYDFDLAFFFEATGEPPMYWGSEAAIWKNAINVFSGF